MPDMGEEYSMGCERTPSVFAPFPKIARYSRLCTITEKIDGTNASIFVSEDLSEFYTASRTK